MSSEPVPTSAPVASTSSTTLPVVSDPQLKDLLPDASGVLVAAITVQGTLDLELVRWSPAGSQSSTAIAMLGGPVLDFDQSAQHMAFLGPSSTAEGPTLYVGRSDSWSPARVGVSSFSWHATVAGRIGWLEPGDPPGLCWATADLVEGLSAAVCVPGSGTQLVGFDSSGFLVVDHASQTVNRLDAEGRRVGSLPGTSALVGPDGQVLVVDRSPDARESFFSVADPDLSDVVDLDWAPRNASGRYGFVAWSPIGHPAELAFLVYDEDERRWELQRWDLGGTLRRAVYLAGRVWDVTWDSTGRYLLVTGVLDESDHVLQVYDTFSQALVFLHFDHWIRDAKLVTKSACKDASHIVAAFADRLPLGVSLEVPQMVPSRDASLESWYFTSARIAGGPLDGDVVSWGLPGFDGTSVDNTNTPNLAVPIGEAASSLGFGMTSLDPNNYGVADWLQLDGALASQACVRAATDNG